MRPYDGRVLGLGVHDSSVAMTFGPHATTQKTAKNTLV